MSVGSLAQRSHNLNMFTYYISFVKNQASKLFLYNIFKVTTLCKIIEPGCAVLQ